MTIEQKFARIIRKALKGGYEPIPGAIAKVPNVRIQTNTASFVTFAAQKLSDGKTVIITIGLNDIIFDHAFAKVIWGDGTKTEGTANLEDAFKLHLQQLALFPSVQERVNYIKSTML